MNQKMPFTKVVRKIMFNDYLTTDLASKRILLLELDLYISRVDIKFYLTTNPITVKNLFIDIIVIEFLMFCNSHIVLVPKYLL